jgi:3'-5' exoribonuclease
MKTIFVENIDSADGPAVNYFQVASTERKTTKRGSAYLSMVLRDRTGEVDAKFWDAPADLEIRAGQFVKVQFEPGTYNDRLQLKVLRIRALNRDEVTIEDFIPASKRNRDEMYAELLRIIAGVTSESLREALTVCVQDHGHLMRDAPAAKKKHQAYLGGLLEHTLSLCGLSDKVANHYPTLNRDILIAAAILHDIGKVHELVYEDHIDYSRAGTLTGHVIQGSILWHRYSGNVDPVTRDHIQHIIASHHGRKEWGAAQVPMTCEAHVFHLLDMIDARIETISDVLARGVNADGMAPYDHAFECALWNGRDSAEVAEVTA